MVRKSSFLAILGLIIGISFMEVILIAQDHVGRWVISLLNDQIKASIPHCKLTSDDYHVSFLRRNAYTNNPKIVCNGKKKVLFFRQVRAKFNFRKIFQKKIILEKLILDTGHSVGISPRSETYKFIEYLIKPVPDPNPIQVSLKELLLLNTSFEEKLTKTVSLRGNSAQMRVFQDEDENFTILPEIKELYIYHKENSSSGHIYKLGNLDVDIFSLDKNPDINIRSFLLRGDGVTLNGKFDIAENNDIKNGFWSGKFDSRLLGKTYAKLFSFNLLANGNIINNIEKPTIDGDVKLNKEENNKIQNQFFFSDTPLPLNDFFAKIQSAVSLDGAYLRLKDVSFSGMKVNGTSIKDLIIDENNYSTKLKYYIKTLDYPNVKLNDINGTFELLGSPNKFDIKLDGSIGSVDGFALQTPVIQFSITCFDNNMLEFSVESEKYIKGFGQINLNKNGAPFLEKFNLNIQDAPLRNVSTKMNWYLSSNIFLSGPLSLYSLNGNASLFLHSQDFNGESSLKGNATLKDGKIDGNLSNPLKSLETKIELNFKDEFDSNLKINLKNFNPNQYSPKYQCVDITSNLEYIFNIKKIFDGQGELSIKRSSLGCFPYKLSLRKEKIFKIQNGILNINGFQLFQDKRNNSFNVDGTIDLNKNINLGIEGKFNLNSFISFFPFIDTLSGNVVADLKITGKTTSPKIDGHANIVNGSIFSESSNLSVSKLKGDFVLKGTSIETAKTTARINDGKALITGRFDLADFSKSKAIIKLTKVNLLIKADTYVVVSGELGLTNERGIPKLSGNIHIENLEFIKNITLKTILDFIRDQLFFNSRKIISIKKKNIVDMIFDLSITSDDDIHIKTDWIDALLSANLKIIGSSKKPLIIGKIVGASGWFGLKNKNFLINSANVIFKKDEPPILDIVGETYLRNASGDNSLIIVNIEGDVKNPIVTLTSDSGLSQKEIFDLLISGEDLANNQISDSDSKLFIVALHNFVRSPSSENFKNIFNALTSIDSLSVTSKYNVQTGSTEPAVIAEKKITENITAVGESFISGASSNTKISLIHYLSPKMFLDGYFETQTTHSNSGAGIDLNYNILSSNNSLVSYSFEGNKSYSEVKLRNVLRINDAKFVDREKVREIRKKLKKYYKDSGFLDVVLKSKITIKDNNITKVSFIISEGNCYKISSFDVFSKRLKREIQSKLESFQGKFFTKRIKENIKKDLRALLKESGYLESKIFMSEYLSDSEKVNIKIKITSSKKYIFKFAGNSNFSEDDLLETINFKKREYPFGSNVIKMLVEGIEKLYRENGYLFASVSYRLKKEKNNFKYKIFIKEENICNVKKIYFEGNNKVDNEMLQEKIKQALKHKRDNFLDPKYVIQEEIEENIYLLDKIYKDMGFSDVKISYELEIDDTGDNADIIYKIDEGKENLVKEFYIEGLPKDLNFKQTQFRNISLAKEERIVRRISQKLSNEGYFNYKITKNLDKETKETTIRVYLGEKIIINDIKIIGNKNVDNFTILKRLKIKPKDFYSEEKISSSKNALLGLGLFNSIKFSLIDIQGDKNRKDLLIEIEERSFDTLDVGLGLHTEYGVHLLAKATNKSLFKDGKTISLSSDIFYDTSEDQVSQGSTDLKFMEPSLFGSDVGFAKTYRYQKLTTSIYEFELDRYVDGLSLYVPLMKDLYFYFGQNFTIESLDNVSKDAIIGNYDDGRFNVSYFQASMKYDKRDNILNPRNGYAVSLEYKLADEFFLSDAEFQTISLHANAIFPFNDDFNFSFNNYTGASFAYDDTTQVPISQRFYLGGSNSIRGFKENSLGPRGEDGSIIGGDVLFANNFEFNYFLLENFSVHSFFDVGNVFLRDIDYDFNDLRYSTGAGFRFNLPIGPIGFDLAFPLDKKDGEDSWRLHFSIGTKF